MSTEPTTASRTKLSLSEVLPFEFYQRPADEVAPDLLGKVLAVVATNDSAPHLARIVETEAYVGQDDLACHAAKGLTKRTSTIFGPPGHAYVYLIYGMYDMFNVVAERQGVPHAVLLRAVELLDEPSAAAPHTTSESLANGPGKLTRALGLKRALHNGLPLDRPPLTIHDGEAPVDIEVTPRVGVAYAGTWADAPLRYYDAGSSAVSRPTPRQLGSGRQ